MLTSLGIENFKGIANRQRIDFAALTLLFGANSAGKSTILHALLFLHELIERGHADIDRTELGGNVLELGGFARLVHRHEIDRTIVLRAEFKTAGNLDLFGRGLLDFPFPDIEDEIDSAWLEFSIRHRRSPTFTGPLVDRLTVGVNDVDEPIVTVESGASLRETEPLYAQVNFLHPLLAPIRNDHPELWPALVGNEPWPEGISDDLVERRQYFEANFEAMSVIALPQRELERALGQDARSDDLAAVRWSPYFALSRSGVGALPNYKEPLRVLPTRDLESDREELASLHASSPLPEKEIATLEAHIAEQELALKHVRTLLEILLLGTIAQLAGFLRDAQYIGPLRTIPPRGFLYTRPGRTTSWADGLAAWDRLLADNLTLVERTNEWLDRLNAGCKVVVQKMYRPGADAEDITTEHVDHTVRRLLLDTGKDSLVLPSEVGAGISQVLPVIVAALEGRSGLTLVEQPEIHVHPALQVELGDLLIEAASKAAGRRLLLIETHSEHLILRILRRVRETTDQELDQDAPEFKQDRMSVLHVESTPDGARIRNLRVDDQGEFIDRWPKGFFAERMRELL